MVFHLMFTFFMNFNLVPPSVTPKMPVESPMSPAVAQTARVHKLTVTRRGHE